MKKIDAIFSSLVSVIDNIVVEGDEEYWTALDDFGKHQFDALSDELVSLKMEVQLSRESLVPSVNFLKLRSVFEDFNRIFFNYPGFVFAKVSYIIFVAEKICSLIDESVADEDVDSGFGFFTCSLGYSCSAFVSNVNNLSNNLAWFNPSDRVSIQELVSYDTKLEFWYCLAMFSCDFDFSIGSEVVFCDSRCVNKAANVVSLLKMYMIVSGKKVTRTNEYLVAPKNSSIHDYDPNLAYAQFGEVVNIMGEYVDRKDVLSKYLSIYHVIENFMFRYPIVSLERAKNGAMFSIRDFKTLYKNVDTKEHESVDYFMKAVFPLSFSGSTIGEEIYTLWESFLVKYAPRLAAVDDFLGLLGCKRANYNSASSLRPFFSSVLYRIRCSVVHNKETEHHISSDNYSEGCRLILEEFYLPALEELIFLLLSKENDVVWYRSESIALWSQTA
ncbi:hypothetical protein KDX30_26155 [Pseudomonas sp. CDFA 553]|uniref:hypothetical protein n=1 Tax=Pseudomonas quasicaspiana TaxID=2829821 RepID=UPI001E5B8AF8|nr:hypothetical protein [Pseudomonas quasicaspiana]MCD5991369.1 hypothetical protein [Pseudomonas quasicaspiana]